MTDSPRPSGDHPQIPVRALITIVGVMAIAVSLIWGVLEQLLPPEVIDPVEIPTPTPELVIDGTPPATPESNGSVVVPGSLQDMLGYAPDRLAKDDLPLNDVATYADISAWMRSQGVPQPANLDDPQVAIWQAELPKLALPTSLTERGLDPIFPETYGFSLLDVDQVLMVGQAPDVLLVIRGRFADDLQDSWIGYQPVAMDDGTTYLSLSPGDKFDLSAQQSRPAMGALNNIIQLQDGTILAATKSSRLEAALDVVNGDSPSLLDRADVQTILAPNGGTEGMVSAVLAKGELLQALPQASRRTGPLLDLSLDSVMQDAIQRELLPPVDLVLIGIHPRTPPVSGLVTTPPALDDLLPRLTMIFVFESAEDADEAASIMEHRFAVLDSPVTGVSYASRYGEATFSTRPGVDDTGRVIMQGSLRRGVADWQAILAERDFGFATWLANENGT